MTTLDTPNPERNAEFEAWVASLPAKSWAKYDLSACRLGWDAALSYIPEQVVGVKPGTLELIEQMIAGTAPMSKWMASVDYSTYDGFEEYLKAQLREKLMLKATLDPNRKDGEKEENLATFVDAGAGALEGALATYRVVRQRVAALAPAQPAAVGVTDEMVERVSVPYDGFTGDVIGSYITREGKQGVVVQQDGTRVVHVYGRSRVEAALRSTP